MSYHQGFSTRLPYDPCAYQKQLSESTAPYSYQVLPDKFENCQRCVYDHYTRPFDADVVDVESELQNITRPASKCPTRKYNPRCRRSKRCISTYDDAVPVVLAPEVCPPVFNNLNWGNDTGIREPRPANCRGRVVGPRRRAAKKNGNGKNGRSEN
jgi:hypothetical protein